MEKTLVSFELAKAAKNKGFNLSENAFWEYEELCKGRATYNWNAIPTCYSAPTQSLLAKWLREKHKIFITISSNVNKDDDDNPDAVEFVLFDWEIKYLSSYTKRFEQEYDYFDYFNTYEEALESALGQALNYIVDEV